MHRSDLGPALERRLTGDAEAQSRVVEDLLASPGLRGLIAARSPEAVALLGLALNEVLYTLTELGGDAGIGTDGTIGLWTDTRLVIFCIRFAGPPLPDWLLANWDRAQEPAVLAPPDDCGWGWLLVREALDAVSQDISGEDQLLLLERRV